MAALSRFLCVKCEREEIHRSIAGRILCCQCDTQWRPLSIAEHTKLNARMARRRNEAADAMARQGAKNRGAKFYTTSTPRPCGHFEIYLATERCRICTLAWQSRKYHEKYPDAPTMQERRSAARDEALESGAKTYVDGFCGKHGFNVERYTSNRWCIQCAAESNAAQRSKTIAGEVVTAPRLVAVA